MPYHIPRKQKKSVYDLGYIDGQHYGNDGGDLRRLSVTIEAQRQKRRIVAQSEDYDTGFEDGYNSVLPTAQNPAGPVKTLARMSVERLKRRIAELMMGTSFGMTARGHRELALAKDELRRREMYGGATESGLPTVASSRKSTIRAALDSGRMEIVSVKSPNLCAKMRVPSKPYEIWQSPDGSWTWKVLKKWQADDNKPYARWMCAVYTPMTAPGCDMGDVYVSEIKSQARLVWKEGNVPLPPVDAFEPIQKNHESSDLNYLNEEADAERADRRSPYAAEAEDASCPHCGRELQHFTTFGGRGSEKRCPNCGTVSEENPARGENPSKNNPTGVRGAHRYGCSRVKKSKSGVIRRLGR